VLFSDGAPEPFFFFSVIYRTRWPAASFLASTLPFFSSWLAGGGLLTFDRNLSFFLFLRPGLHSSICVRLPPCRRFSFFLRYRFSRGPLRETAPVDSSFFFHDTAGLALSDQSVRPLPSLFLLSKSWASLVPFCQGRPATFFSSSWLRGVYKTTTSPSFFRWERLRDLPFFPGSNRCALFPSHGGSVESGVEAPLFSSWKEARGDERSLPLHARWAFFFFLFQRPATGFFFFGGSFSFENGKIHRFSPEIGRWLFFSFPPLPPLFALEERDALP